MFIKKFLFYVDPKIINFLATKKLFAEESNLKKDVVESKIDDKKDFKLLDNKLGLLKHILSCTTIIYKVYKAVINNIIKYQLILAI